jgi:hypothetical protein
MRVVAALLLCAGAAHAERPPPTWYETSLLVAAEASLAADMLQTLDIKRHSDVSWNYYGTLLTRPGLWETNPILGQHPSDAKVAVYFAGAALATGAAWYALPSRWRMLVPLGVLALQIPQLVRNGNCGLSIRF